MLIAAVWFAYSGMTADGGGTIPGHGYAAMTAGIVLLFVVGVGLMALLFYSSRHGYDEAPRTRNRRG